jgi:hypothetical protein
MMQGFLELCGLETWASGDRQTYVDRKHTTERNVIAGCDAVTKSLR